VLEADERSQRALELSFAYLNRRERAVAELRLYLERKGIAADAAEACVRTLLEDGYLDDGRFALMFVHDRRELDGWGSERIRRELAAKGVDRDLVETALAQHEAAWGGGESELDRALALLRRRFPSPPQERRDRDRALGILIRKGFDTELALDALTAHARSRS
jgi:regulatory protein